MLIINKPQHPYTFLFNGLFKHGIILGCILLPTPDVICYQISIDRFNTDNVLSIPEIISLIGLSSKQYPIHRNKL